MALYIAHARSNEMGQTVGGQPGDQTKHEVEVSDFVEYDWTDFFRPIPEKIDPAEYSRRAVTICENDNIGYDHNDRYSMFDIAKARGWDFKGLSTPCCTDCSQMQSAIINSFGIPCNRWMWTGSMIGDMAKTGAFTRHTYRSKDELQNGDILLTLAHGHTATVVRTDAPQPVPFTRWVGEAYGAALVPVYKNPTGTTLLPEWSYLGTGNLFEVHGESGGRWKIWIAGQYYGWIEKRFCLRKTPERTGLVSTDLHLRQNAGTGYKSMAVMPRGTVVQICDTKPATTGVLWNYVIYNGMYGFASSRYIK